MQPSLPPSCDDAVSARSRANPADSRRARRFVATFKGADHCFDVVNDSFVGHFGERDYRGNAARRLFPEIEHQHYPAILDRAFQTGERISLRGSLIQTRMIPGGPLVERVIDIDYIPTRDARGDVDGLYVEGLVSAPPPMEQLARRAVECGARSLSDSELLALLLHQKGGDADPSDTAAHLLHRFDGLGGVLSASMADLERIAPATASDGLRSLQTSAAVHLKLVREIGRRVLRQKVGRRTVLSSSSLVRAFVSASLRHAPREEFHVLFLDNSLGLIADEVLGEGTVAHVHVYSREVIRRALELSATSLILVHNHPSGMPTVSRGDRDMTAEIVRAGHPLGIEVHDHLIVAGDAIVSFAAEGLLKTPRR